MKKNQLIRNSNYKIILQEYASENLIPNYVYHRFLHSIESHNIEDFISSGEIIIRSLLMNIYSNKKINVPKNPGWHSLLKIAWDKKIITNESIYAYLWVFAKSANSIKNGETTIGNEALIHVSVFFSFLEEIMDTCFQVMGSKKKRHYLSL